ncbi:MAG: hypothetical protein K2J16_03220 [Clostridia bacterium]|nr:hypothetical protein [Clostridia bacterium]
MESKFENKIAFYAENESGLYNEIILDLFERDYEYNLNIDKRDLFCRKENRLKEFLVSQQVINAVYDRVDALYNSGSYYWEDKSYEQRQLEKEMWERERANRTVIAKEKIWDAISWKLDERELRNICSYDFAYEKDDYYNFDLIIDRIHAFMSGEKPVRYFTDWCIVLMRCLYDSMHICADKRISSIYDEIADSFDGLGFMSSNDSEKERQTECKEFVANLKYYNHQIDDIKRHRTTDFEKNGVVIYVAYEFCIGGSNDIMYSICVADKRRHLVNYYFAPNLIMEEEYNITILTSAEFETLSCEYVEYKLDISLNMDSQLEEKC